MADTVELYGIKWPLVTLPIARELHMVRRGGRFKLANGNIVGEGMPFHFRRFQEFLWPEKVWHKWNIKELEIYLAYRIIGELGPASSGKTYSASTNALADYYAWPECTTVMVSSTTRESLEMRIWGEIKKLHRAAKSRWSWLPGHLIEGRQRIVTDSRAEAAEGRDFRNGIVGVACKKGENFQGIGEYVGIKNKRVRLFGDELHLMPKGYTDAFANLKKNLDFKAVGLGNPKDIMDALGIMCEPAPEMGGWDSGVDQEPGMKTWPTKMGGICLQLPGSDSPNLDGKLGCPLITQKDIDSDIVTYGKDSLQYSMMDEGRMPRGQGSRRVITRQMCKKFFATEEVIWADSKQVDIGSLDAAYRGVGGDRCVFIHQKMGRAMSGEDFFDCLCMIEATVVPVKAIDPRSEEEQKTPEDQIAEFVRDLCVKKGITPDNFGFDSTGRGSLVSAFARIWDPNVGIVEFGGKPSERMVSSDLDVLCKDHYFNFVTELWFSASYAVQAGQVRQLTDAVIEEGCMREWFFSGANKIQVEPKDKMKIKSGRSPDLFDAYVVGVEIARRKGFAIRRIPAVANKRMDSQWKRDLKERARKLQHGKDLTYR